MCHADEYVLKYETMSSVQKVRIHLILKALAWLFWFQLVVLVLVLATAHYNHFVFLQSRRLREYGVPNDESPNTAA